MNSASGLKKAKRVRVMLLTVIVATLLVILSIFSGSHKDIEIPKEIRITSENDANISINRIHQTATRDGVTEWRLEARSAKYMTERNQAVFDRLLVTFFLKDGKEVHLSADHGILQTDTNNIEVQGNVIVKNADYRLETEQLFYRHQDRIFFSEKPVNISGTSFHLAAESISFDLDTNQTRLDGNIKGIFREKVFL